MHGIMFGEVSAMSGTEAKNPSGRIYPIGRIIIGDNPFVIKPIPGTDGAYITVLQKRAMHPY